MITQILSALFIIFITMLIEEGIISSDAGFPIITFIIGVGLSKVDS